MEGLIIALILIPIFAMINSSQDKAETERIQGMSDSQLENRLVELCNIALTENPKRFPGNPQRVRDRADKKWQAAVKESKKIAAELKNRTGVDYKDASTVCAEWYIAGIQNGTIEISKPSAKNASVVKRAIVGGVIASPAGAVVGAVSAADQNSRNR